MAYTTIDKPTDYFNTKLYTGNGSAGHSITGIGHAPDLVWIKQRDSRDHFLFNSVVGATKYLASNLEQTEQTDTNTMTAFGSDGFTLGNGVGCNENNDTHCSWNWKAGTSFTNDASSTGIGTIDSTGSVSDTSGFSIVSYTGSGTSATVKHGLSTAPQIVIVKNRGDARPWTVGSTAIGFDHILKLNEALAKENNDEMFGDTAPTSSVFTVNNSVFTNSSGHNYIAYCFAEKKGYSKFGSYTGNGQSGDSAPFIYTGFKPAFVIFKRSSGAQDWGLFDNKRSNYNPVDELIYPNYSNAESGDNANKFDFVSNGFKLRASGQQMNQSGDTYIYMCFAESPFTTSTGIPTTAR